MDSKVSCCITHTHQENCAWYKWYLDEGHKNESDDLNTQCYIEQCACS